MVQKSWKIAVTSALLAGSCTALALPFNSFDPRSMAMGGAGVAVGDAKMAPFFNPALLTVTSEKDDFSLALPIIGVRAYDPKKFITSLDDFQKGNYVNNLDSSITAYNGAQTSANLTAVSNNISTLSTQFTTLSDKPLQAELGAAMVIGVPSKTFGGAFYANGWGAMGGVIKYRDNQLLQDFVNVSTQVANTLNVDCAGSFATPTVQCANSLTALQNDPVVTSYFQVNTTNPASPTVTSTFNSNTNLQSSVDIRGVVLSEVGLALSREFGTDTNAWGLGITPKIVRVTLLDYSADVNSGKASNASDSDYTAKYSGANLDLGLAKNYGNGWRTGFVIKNIIPHNYDFKRIASGAPAGSAQITSGTIKLKPQARIGASRTTNWSTLAMDLDLTANDPAGLENKSQYLALGGELDLWLIQLRLGYRANLKDSARNVTSVGLGLGPVDVTVAGSSNEVGVAASLGFTF